MLRTIFRLSSHHTHTHTHTHNLSLLTSFLMKTHCVRCQIWTESLYIIQTGCSLQLGRSSLPSKALVRSRKGTCTIYGGQSALRRVFLRVRRVSPVAIIPSNAPHSFTPLPLLLHTLILFRPTRSSRAICYPRRNVTLPAEATEMRKHPLSLSLAKPQSPSNVENCCLFLETYITNSFCKKCDKKSYTYTWTRL
jgi:hypothetical protein